MRKEAILVLVCSGVVLYAATLKVRADTTANPYQGIVDRNVFNLRPPTPLTIQPPPTPPPPKITLNGFITFLGKKQALLQTPGTPQPGQPPSLESYILAEGEQDGDIQVLEIDEKAGTVKVKNHGTIQTLDFENNGSKPTAVAGALPLPNFQPTPGLLQGRFQIPTNPNPTVLPRLPARTMRLPPTAPPNAVPGQGVPITPGVVAPQAQNDLTPEEQATLIEVQRLQLQNQRGAQPKVQYQFKNPIPPPASPNQ